MYPFLGELTLLVPLEHVTEQDSDLTLGLGEFGLARVNGLRLQASVHFLPLCDCGFTNCVNGDKLRAKLAQWYSLTAQTHTCSCPSSRLVGHS